MERCGAVYTGVAPYNVEPYLLINLGQAYTIDNVTVTGLGSTGLFTSFNVFVGTGWTGGSFANNDLLTAPSTDLTGSIEVLSVTLQPDGGSGWSISTNSTLSSIITLASLAQTSNIQYVELVATGTPDDGITYDAALAGEITVNDPMPTPEPTTMGLAGLALLALGSASRFRKVAP